VLLTLTALQPCPDDFDGSGTVDTADLV